METGDVEREGQLEKRETVSDSKVLTEEEGWRNSQVTLSRMNPSS